MDEIADLHSASDEYAARFSGEIGRWLLGVQERIVLEMVRDYKGCSVLDVGGGHGQITRPLLNAGFNITVHASSVEALHGVRDLVSSRQIKYSTGDLIQLPFLDRAFDIVTCFRLLPHYEPWPELIKALCRVSSNLVIVDYPTVRSVNFLSHSLFHIKKYLETNTRPFTLFSHREIAASFSVCDFQLREKVGEFFFPMVLHRALKSPAFSDVLERFAALSSLTRFFGSPVIASMTRANS